MSVKGFYSFAMVSLVTFFSISQNPIETQLLIIEAFEVNLLKAIQS